MTWKPTVTVAAVIENDGNFLFVEENSAEGVVINQPAGHVEPGESLLEAVARETLEETGYHFVPQALIGVYYWHSQRKGITYMRFTFSGRLTGHEADRPLDHGILRVLWLSPAALAAEAARHRGSIVGRCVDDYLAGRRYPLEVITTFLSTPQR